MFGGLVGYSNKEITIENCYVDGGKVSSKNQNCGGLAGGLFGTSTVIKGSWNSAHVSSNSNYQLCMGGIIGYSNGKTDINYCYNKGLIESTYSKENYGAIGGLIGYTYGDILINHSYNTGEVRGDSSREIGGLVGDIYGGTIENCYNTGKISGVRAIGGLCGWTSAKSDKNLRILDSYNSGNIDAKLMDGMYSEAGGIIGCACTKYEIKNCYNQGNITALGGYVGGFTGYSGGLVDIQNCYNSGLVSTINGQYIGGILGFSGVSSTIINVFNSGNVESKSYEGTDVDMGGIIGWTQTTELTNCYNFNDISAKSNNIGGISGMNVASNTVYTSCFNSGKILGEKGYIGGIAGFNTSKATFNKCHNKGDLLSNLDNPNANEKGEIVGYASQLNVTECTYLQKTTNAKDNGANPKEQSEINDIMSVQNFVNLMNSYVTDNNKDSTKTKLKTWKVENGMPVFAE